MGGKGSGGRRPGSGRKPKSAHLRGIDGGASHSAGRPPADSVATKPLQRFDPPADLTDDALATWNRLAPLAFEARTLTLGTAYAFSLLCRNIVLERKMARDEPGAAGHRGIVQRIDAELLSFNLRPNGKALYEPEAPVEKPKTGLRRFLA